MHARINLVASLMLACSWPGPATAGDWEGCTELSFAPLDYNVPACTRVLAGDDLSDTQRAQAHAARAEALGFALTYHAGHQIDREAMLADMATDLDAAVSLDPAWHGRRGELRSMMGDPAGARDDYTAAIAHDAASAAHYLSYRALAFEALGQPGQAIADLTAALRLDIDRPDIGLLMRRGLLLEATGDPMAALRDYRAILDIAPDHAPARARRDAISP